MISKNEDGSFNLRVGDANIFLGIIEEQHKVFKENLESIKDLESLADSNKTPEDNMKEIIRKNNNQIFPAYICSVFTALFLEAFIYDYCARKKSASMAQHLDKLDPPAKWIIGTQLFNEKGIDNSKKGYADLQRVFQVRNKLAHNKSKEFNFSSEKSIARTEVIKPQECLEIIKNVLTELTEIDKDEIYAKILISRINNLD